MLLDYQLSAGNARSRCWLVTMANPSYNISPGESVGELNQGVFCGEVGPSKEELGVLADARVI